MVNDLTVRLNLSQPLVPLLAALTDRAGMMVSPKAAQRARRQARHPAGVRRARIKFVQRVAQGKIVVERFADYWDKGELHRRPRRVRAHHRLDLAPGQPALGRSAHDRARVAHRPGRDPRRRQAEGRRRARARLPDDPAQRRTTAPRARRSPTCGCARRSTSRSTARRSSRRCSTASTSRATSSSARRAPTTTRRSRCAKRDVARARQLLREAGQPNLAFTLIVPPGARPAGGGADHPGHAGGGRHHDDDPDPGERHDAAVGPARATSRPTSPSGAAGPTPTATSSRFTTCKGAQNDSHYCNAERGRAPDQGAPGRGPGRAQEALRPGHRDHPARRAAAASCGTGACSPA